MDETSKSIHRRIHDINFSTKYFVGTGIDIGAGGDNLGNYAYIFPKLINVSPWDVNNGDAQYLKSVPDNYYDFVHSSHCLEHLHDPYIGLQNWWRVLKPGGYMIVMIPDEDLYEQGFFPSKFNGDHKWTFTIYKEESWCAKSINLLDIIKSLDRYKICKLELLDRTFNYNIKNQDQTRTSKLTESAIEVILQKQY
jgi:SAM-dependent methyltransferase